MGRRSTATGLSPRAANRQRPSVSVDNHTLARFCIRGYPGARMKGRLVRQVPVQLVDLSLSGCLLETSQQIQPGSTGELQVSLQGTEYYDAVNVVRAAGRQGSHLVSVGGEFTWRSGPGGMSERSGLRAIVPPSPRPL